MLKSATNIFPTEIITKGKFYFIGRILQILEVQWDTLPLTICIQHIQYICWIIQVMNTSFSFTFFFLLLYFACYSLVSVLKELRSCLVQTSLDLMEILVSVTSKLFSMWWVHDWTLKASTTVLSLFVWTLCCVVFSLKTGKFCPAISQSFLPIHVPLDKSGSLLTWTKSSFRMSSRWER